jgi:tetratricopeptide (TPR) repeat protein
VEEGVVTDVEGAARRAARLATAAAILLVFLVVGAFCLTRVTDTDLWWHLATGDLIRRTGEVPRTDPFSYTAAGLPWTDVHWLFQAALSLVHEQGGLIALTVLKTALILGLFALLYARGRRVAPAGAVAAALLLAALACQERFLMRPEIVSWLLLAATLAALERALSEPGATARRRILWLGLPALQVLWANVQGLFMLGPAMAALALVTSLVVWARAPAAARDPGQPVDFLVGLAAMAVAGLANPYGAAALRVPFDQFFVHLGGESLLSRTIAEFRPPLSGYLVTPSIRAFVVLAAVTGLALLANARRVPLFDLLVSGATFYVALRARRNIPIFAVAAVPVLLRSGAAAWGGVTAWGGGAARGGLRAAIGSRRAAGAAAILAPALLAAAALGLLLDVTSNRFYLRRPTERWWGIGPIPWYFPDEAARFAARVIPGQVFHPLAAGGFLIHAWEGERRVFIDGRNDPYLHGVLETYLRAISAPEAFEETVRRYQITAVLWPHWRAQEGRALLDYLARRRGWVRAHLDPAAVVYLRADAATADLLPPPAAAPDGEAGGLYEALARRLGERPFAGPPIREIALGEFFSASGDPGGAVFFIERALEKLPRSAVLLHEHGLALPRLGRAAAARAAYRAALAADPGFLPPAGALGMLLLEEGQVEEAARLLERAYEEGDRSARLLIGRARLLDRRGEVRAAVDAYREALSRAPRDVGLLLDVARFYARHRETDAALALYTRASEADPEDAATADEMSGFLASVGRIAAALDVARDGARRALERIEHGAPGAGGDGDRRLLLRAARLELRSGRRDRAVEWVAALARTGLLRDSDLRDLPDLRDLAPPGPERPRPREPVR